MVSRTAAGLAAAAALFLGTIVGGVSERYLLTDDGGAAEAAAVTSPVGSTVPQAINPQSAPVSSYSVADIAEMVTPSTVYIEASDGPRGASGTGAVMSADGLIVTNQHVVAAAGDSGRITVTFHDGTLEEATLVASTEDYDLAVLTVDRTDLTPLVFADSDEVRVGDPVVAVGAPLGLEGTVTSGIVSALNRAVTAGDMASVSYINAIQTDAAINPGNSGGPLVNERGELIGINTAIAQGGGLSAATGSIGLGFAIPSNQVARTTDQLITQGYATYPIIGVLLDGRYTEEGVLVSMDPTQDGTPPITPGGPAEQAGVEPGDVILSIDGVPMASSDEAIVFIRAHAPGDTLVLHIVRDGQEIDIPVVLGEQRAN